MEFLDWNRTLPWISVPDSVPEGITLKEYVGPEIAAYLHPHWHNFEPLDTFYYFILGIVYMIGGVMAVCGNFLVLFMFSKYESLRKPANFLVMALAFSDLMMMITLVPQTMIGLLAGGTWPFGYGFCIQHSFCGAFFGYSQITTLVCIAYDRHNVIVKSITAKQLTWSRAKSMLMVAWGYALFWSIGPLVGFGGYAMDGIISSCSFDYMNREPTNVKYFIACFIFCYLLPLCTIMKFYYSIVKAVWAHEAILKEQAKKMNVNSLRSNEDTRRVSAEIRIAKVAITNVGLWVISWTPFAIVALTGVIGNQDALTPMTSLLPVLLAKMSCIYNPIIYAISHPKYRECLKKAFPYLFCCIKEPTMKQDNLSAASETTKIQEP